VADTPVLAWRATFKRRLVIAAAGLVVWTAAIEARLVYLQVVRHADLSASAERQQWRTRPAPAKRGDIVDRRGHVLALSVDADTVYAVPSVIEDPAGTAAALCGALGDCSPAERRALAGRLDRQGRHFEYVRRQISPELAARVAALELEGVGFMKESRRYYPNKHLASHLLGYVGVENTGLGGLESAYDSLVRGRPGTILIQTDARRRVVSRVERPATVGASLELTVDQYLQHVAERELAHGVEWSGAEGGSAVLLDPFTGEILAMANAPTFNPNTFRDASPDARRNRAVQDLYEPGSTFKIVTAGAAFEEQAVRPDSLIDARGGVIRFGSRVIHDTHDYGVLSFEDVIVKSSNVGAIRVALTLGPETVGAYVRRFGFGRPASRDFRGQNPGIVWDPSALDDSALASVAMGYQVGVTALQMAAAVASIANGGELVEPRAIRAVVKDGARTPVPRRVVGRTVSAATAAQLTAIMEGVVEHGTGTAAALPGYTVAGKTGTASKILDGAYSKSDYNVSFVGFVPSRNPVLAMVVVVDSPHRVSPYGGVVAAPIFQGIAAAAMRHMGVRPSIDAPAPVLVSARREGPGARPASTTRAVVAVESLSDAAVSRASVFPDLTGLSARDAVRVLARLGLAARVHGRGVVVEQHPSAGEPLDSSGAATLWLGRGPAADSARP
jgi:cell division protein FtsI (penicillin-binding protein 3)